MKYRMSYLLMKIKILSHAYVNPNVSSKILRLALFLFIHKPLRMYIRLFQRFQKIFFSKKLTHCSNSAISIKESADIHIFEHISARLQDFSRFRKLKREMLVSIVIIHNIQSTKVVCNGSSPWKFVPYNYFSRAPSKSQSLICTTPIYVLPRCSRLIPLAMLFLGIKRNKYSSIFVIDRRRGLYSYFSFFLFITRLKIIASN